MAKKNIYKVCMIWRREKTRHVDVEFIAEDLYITGRGGSWPLKAEVLPHVCTNCNSITEDTIIILDYLTSY